jgi:hypothetical protein
MQDLAYVPDKEELKKDNIKRERGRDKHPKNTHEKRIQFVKIVIRVFLIFT